MSLILIRSTRVYTDSSIASVEELRSSLIMAACRPSVEFISQQHWGQHNNNTMQILASRPLKFSRPRDGRIDRQRDTPKYLARPTNIGAINVDYSIRALLVNSFPLSLSDS